MRVVWRKWCSDNKNVGELDWVLDSVDSLIFLPGNWLPELLQFDPCIVILDD